MKRGVDDLPAAPLEGELADSPVIVELPVET